MAETPSNVQHSGIRIVVPFSPEATEIEAPRAAASGMATSG